ncbi:MAG: RecQ family ATP-dependent DNA helicase [Actinobacteria bacterium]|nr:RecQ family ATP-dependent DNA helicase [Actinomycetota bacterium]
MATADRAQALLLAMLGEGAAFRAGQLEAVLALVDDRSRVLVVERTGWGKSLIYFMATRLLRDGGAGPTILISPLLSLMRDQMRMADAIGVRALTINSENVHLWNEIEGALAAADVDLLLVSPERLSNQRFRERTLGLIERGIGMFVVDEAHCISDWGHDFRPDYRRIKNLVTLLPPTVPLLATTATANDRVVADIEDQLGPDLVVIRGSLARDSLRLQAIALSDQAERLAWLAENLDRLSGSGIVYCLTIADCERVSDWLQSRGYDVAAYHSGLNGEKRRALEEALRANQVKALVATIALGMGFDKRDLGFVVHYQRPGSAVAYYQQIGRAGRAVERADVVLLAGREDDQIESFFIHGAFPPEDNLRQVLTALEAGEGLTVSELEDVVNLSRGRLQQALKVLELDEAVFRDGSRHVRSATAWTPDNERIRSVTEQRERELGRMQDYVRGESCLMEFLQRELDDPAAASCGRCAVCAGDFVSREADAALVREAVGFLRRSHRLIQPRKKWPDGGVDGRRGMIPQPLRAEEGRALAIYGDAGWGRLVSQAKYGGGRFDEELVEAVAELIEQTWRPGPAPEWVVAMPSLRTDLVPEFAARLAARLGLPYSQALVKVKETPPQKEMENSRQQLRNVIGAFEVDQAALLPGPALLVDDVVDSRWSLTECARLLRESGSGPVYPCALADSSRSGDS